MMLSYQQLYLFLPKNLYVKQWHSALAQCLPDYEINTPQRIAAFLAQCAHESAGFTALKENLNYRWQTLRTIFPKYFSTDETAKYYATLPNKQEAIANLVYANRMGNGPESSGDGYRYCGRGLIQITGKTNYDNFAQSLEIPLAEAVEYLETFEGAVQSACWFWESNNLNQYADIGDIVALTKKINGGTIGLDDRIKQYNSALYILGV